MKKTLITTYSSLKHVVICAALNALITTSFLISSTLAADKRHGLSTFGDLKYTADFKHFDYVNPQAPKGGTLSMIGDGGVTTFNSLNPYISKGDAAQGMQYVFDSLMVRAYDEPDAVYGLLAHSAELSSDKKSVIFYLREQAKFSDGTPVTAQDVVFSVQTLKKDGQPYYAQSLRDVEKVEALDSLTVRFEFKGEQIRDLPLLVASLPVFSKAFYAKNDFAKSTLKPPIGSGPYKVGKLRQGTFITYERREDYWAKDLPVNVGRHNFDILRYEYYKDRTAELEALKSGQYDLREEFYSKLWATAYNIASVKNGQLVRHTMPDDRIGGAQGFFFNTRKEKLSDPRVREAIAMMFNFEWSNKNLFYGIYTRTHSFFENSDLKATGKPSSDELALLEPFRDKLSAKVFAKAVSPPVSDISGNDRKLRRQALRLLKQAGWSIKRGKLINDTGEQLTIEILLDSPGFERIAGPYATNLKKIGIATRITKVDAAQYQERLKSFDFDLTTQRYVVPNTPGVVMRSYWGSAAANAKGSFNLSGIADPVVDALIEKVIAAQSRQEMKIAVRALDRVLRASHYWVPQWYKGSHNIAFWNKFSWPETKSKFDRGVIETWWYDKQKADKLADTN